MTRFLIDSAVQVKVVVVVASAGRAGGPSG